MSLLPAVVARVHGGVLAFPLGLALVVLALAVLGLPFSFGLALDVAVLLVVRVLELSFSFAFVVIPVAVVVAVVVVDGINFHRCRCILLRHVRSTSLAFGIHVLLDVLPELRIRVEPVRVHLQLMLITIRSIVHHDGHLDLVIHGVRICSLLELVHQEVELVEPLLEALVGLEVKVHDRPKSRQLRSRTDRIEPTRQESPCLQAVALVDLADETESCACARECEEVVQMPTQHPHVRAQVLKTNFIFLMLNGLHHLLQLGPTREDSHVAAEVETPVVPLRLLPGELLRLPKRLEIHDLDVLLLHVVRVVELAVLVELIGDVVLR